VFFFLLQFSLWR